VIGAGAALEAAALTTLVGKAAPPTTAGAAIGLAGVFRAAQFLSCRMEASLS
jgi:hypothetical protein